MLQRWRSAWRRHRDERTLRKRAIPDPLWQLTLARYPFLARRSEADRATLRDLATLFLAEKEFTGAQGFEVSDEIAVAIAAQACLPILKLGLTWYDGFVVIVVHPDEVVVRREVMDEDGVVHEYDEHIVGEAPGAGPMVLTWKDIETAGEWAGVAYNIVIHEFVHVLDMCDGAEPDGIPPLATAAAREAWASVIDPEYEAFCDRVEAGKDTLIDPYGIESVDEFFAVASEAFFTAPNEMLAAHPVLYELLVGYYLQDPARR